MCTIFDEREKLWINPKPRLLGNLKVSYNQYILDRLLHHGNRIAQINADTGNRMTFHAMRLETVRIAQNLLKKGIKSHQAISIMAVHSEHLVPAFLASLCLACPVVPLHPMLSKDEIVRTWMKTKPSAVFCDADVYNEIAEALKEVNWDVKVFTFGWIDGVEPVENLLIETGNENEFKAVDCKMEDIALMCCSSGTTGPSKCTSLPFANTAFTPDDMDSDTIAFSNDLIYWTAAIKPITDSIYNGFCRVITSGPFTPELRLTLIQQFKVTVLYIYAHNLVLCLKSECIKKMDLSSVKSIYTYGGKWPSSLGATFKRYFPNSANCLSWYGMTEVGAMTKAKIDADGLIGDAELCEDCQLKIIDESGNRCSPGMNGEVCYKLKHEFRGYLDDPKANETAIDDEGFFHTGDVGRFDENGHLSIEGRTKNDITVFYSDRIILPSEMEEYLLTVPDILEACVVGVPVAFGGNLPAAVIIRKKDSELTTHDVHNVIAEKYSSGSKLGGGIYFVDSMPKTNSGKIIRGKVTEMASEMFKTARYNDPHILAYLEEIPEDFRDLI